MKRGLQCIGEPVRSPIYEASIWIPITLWQSWSRIGTLRIFSGGERKTFLWSAEDSDECKGRIQSDATPPNWNEAVNLSISELISPTPCNKYHRLKLWAHETRILTKINSIKATKKYKRKIMKKIIIVNEKKVNHGASTWRKEIDAFLSLLEERQEWHQGDDCHQYRISNLPGDHNQSHLLLSFSAVQM